MLESAKRYDDSIPRDEAKRNYERCYKDIVYGTFCKEHCFVGKRIKEIRSKIDPVALGIF